MDNFDLARFHRAQDGAYEIARAELQAGHKRSHWMWFMFPQMRGLGFSGMAQTYGIVSQAEAEAYLADPILGRRLIELFQIVLDQRTATAREIFGAPDDLKFRSCATLFAALPGAPPVFAAAIERFFAGGPDLQTLALLGRKS